MNTTRSEPFSDCAESERQRRDEMSVRVPFLLLDGEVAPGFTNLTLGTVVESESCHVLVLSAGLF